MSDVLGSFSIIIVLFLVVLAILWFILPFAIFGTKDKLAELIRESKKTNDHLVRLRSDLNTFMINSMHDDD